MRTIPILLLAVLTFVPAASAEESAHPCRGWELDPRCCDVEIGTFLTGTLCIRQSIIGRPGGWDP